MSRFGGFLFFIVSKWKPKLTRAFFMVLGIFQVRLLVNVAPTYPDLGSFMPLDRIEGFARRALGRRLFDRAG
jgi:hypothetical protein